MKKNYFTKITNYLITGCLLSLSIQSFSQSLSGGTIYPINGTQSALTSFSTIQNAVTYAAANGVTGTGNIILQLQTGYNPVNEPSTGIFFDSVPGVNAARGIIIRPASGFSTTISGSDTAKGLLNFRNCGYFTIEGRQGGTGSSGLTFYNQCSSSLDTTCTIRFYNGANNIAIRYCNIQGASKAVTNGGVILFSVPNSYAGNSFITIENCNIDGTSNAHNGICVTGSVASASLENASDTIRNNNIYDNFNSVGSWGNSAIRIDKGANAWYISGNNIYQTVSRTYTAQNLHYGILVGATAYLSTDYFTIINNYIGGSAQSCVGTMTLNATSVIIGYAGIYMNVGNNTLVSGNTIKNISLTSAGTSTYNNAGIYSFLNNSGSVTINSNTLDSIQYTNSAASIIYSGIHLATTMDTLLYKNISPGFSVSNNAVKNITLNTGVTTNNTQLYGIRLVAATVASQGTTSYYDNMIVNVNNNTIESLRSNGTYTNTFLCGFQANASNGASSSHIVRIYPTITGNTFRNLFCNGSIVTVGTNPVVSAIVFVNTSSGTSSYADTIKIRSNTIYNLFGNNTNDINTSVGGIYIGKGRTDISRNKIYNLYNAAYASANNPYVFGINIYALEVTGSVNDNFISLGDTATTNQAVYGILNQISTTQINMYNNSILISGNAVNKNSAAILRGDPLTFSGNGTFLNVTNNLLVNRRSSSGANVALAFPGTASFISDNNSLLTSSVSSACYYNAGASNLATWSSNTTNDFNSYSSTIGATTDFTQNPPVISLADLFANSNYSSVANFRIDSSKVTSWLVYGKSNSSAGSNYDNFGNTRTIVTGTPNCIGGHEFVTTTTPPNCTVTGNYLLADSLRIFFASRELARIIWQTGSIPSSVTAKYYSGKIHPNYTSGNKGASYITLTASTGSSYKYQLKNFYGAQETGNITNTAINARIAFYTGSLWRVSTFKSANTTSSPFSVYTDSLVNTSYPINATSAIMLTDTINPLPIALLNFTAKAVDRDAELNWITSSEINNAYFSIERSFDNQNFTDIGKVDGAINSNELMNYIYIDRNAKSFNQQVIYYRLRQVDVDGHNTLSNVVAVGFNDKVETVVNIMPNPFEDNMTVSFNSNTGATVMLKVTDMNGRVVIDKGIQAVAGSNSVGVDVTDLSSGIYFIQLNFGNEISVNKIVKLKN